FVAKINGITFIDDSKATSAAATISALENFTQKNVILLLSGKSKNEDYSALVEQMKSKVKHVYLFGEIVSAIENTLQLENFPFTVVENMKQAVYGAFQMATQGDVILLSPAGASFDLYKNYSERGDDFVRVVQSLTGVEG
ncbi:MAG: glutamate ligase domain-containing protein, partial [Pseudothermotoga sp.]